MATRGRGKPFKKGESGNKAGRPKAHPELRALIAKGLELGLPKLLKWAKNGDDEQFRFAMTKLMEWGIAKPAPTIGNENAEKLERIAEALRG